MLDALPDYDLHWDVPDNAPVEEPKPDFPLDQLPVPAQPASPATAQPASPAATQGKPGALAAMGALASHAGILAAMVGAFDLSAAIPPTPLKPSDPSPGGTKEAQIRPPGEGLIDRGC